MTSAPKRRLAALSEQLVAPIPDQGLFETIPVLKKVGGSSVGPRVLGKVVIVTGMLCSELVETSSFSDFGRRNEFVIRNRSCFSS